MAIALTAGAVITGVAFTAPAQAFAAQNSSARGGATVSEFGRATSRPLTGAALANLQHKQAQAAAYVQAKMNSLAHASASVSTDTTTVTTKNLAEPYFKQATEDFCGAATTTMIADYLHYNEWSTTLSSASQQNQAAYWVGTDDAYKSGGVIKFSNTSGTDWEGNDNVPSYPYKSDFPIDDFLNYEVYKRTGGVWYQPVPLPGSPSSSDQTYFLNALVFDVDNNHPEADNQYSIPGYQLPYQPNGTWMHWWSARGYKNSGHTTGINDPAGWANSTEQWVTTTGGAHTVVISLGGRGYVW